MLKKAGIIDIKDAAKAEPWMVRKAGPRGGSYTLKEIVSKYDDIVSGKAVAVKLPPAELKRQKREGAEVVKGDKIIVPKFAGERVRVTPQGKISRTYEKPGIKTVEIDVPYHRLSEWLRDVKKDSKQINRMKSRNEKFGVRFFGGNHMTLYANIEQLIEALEHYGSVEKAMSKRPKDQAEYFRNLEIVRTTAPEWRKFTSEQKTARKRSQAHDRARRTKRAGRSPHTQTAYRAERAAEQKKYRASLSPSEKKDYQAKARARAKKSRDKK